MSEEDRLRWDARYASEVGTLSPGDARLPDVFEPYARLFPTAGHALDLACGRGTTSAWLAARGLDVLAVDISAVALREAAELAATCGVGDRCRFELVDLDLGLPAGPPAAVVVCHMFRDERLDAALTRRLAPGGLLAVAVRSEVGAGPGRFRAGPGELQAAFSALSVIAEGEGDGRAWLLATK